MILMGNKNKNADQQSLVFDPNDRLNFVQGFRKRKQERLERAKAKAQEREREVRKLLRKKKKEALERVREENAIKNEVNVATSSEIE